MTALKLVMTTAGLGRFAAAQADQDIDLTIARIGLTAAPFVAAPTLGALPGEFRRLSTVSGSIEAQNIVHLTVTDDEPISYQVRGFGLFLDDGTLFASYSQPGLIAEKAAGALLALAIDIAFPVAGVDQISFGPTSFLNPPGTEARAGVVELATLAEAEAGDTRRVTTGAVVRAMIADAVAAIGAALDGLAARTVFGGGLVKGGGNLTANRTLTVDAATAAQVRAGAAGDVAVTPAGLAALASDFAATGEYQVGPGVLHKLGTVAGPFPEGPVAVPFTTAFPTACRGVFITGINGSGSNLRDIYMQRQAMTPAGFTAFVQKAGSDGTTIDGFDWLAIGN